MMRGRTSARSLFAHPWVAYPILASMVVLTLICMEPPNILLLKRIAARSTQIMLLFLASGIFFLIMDERRLLYTAFACAAALCLYFKWAANISLGAPVKTSEPSFLMAHCNTSDLADYEVALASLLDRDPDVISFLEITPGWDQLLQAYLSERYPHQVINTRIDFLGGGLFSKFPIEAADTLFYEEVPNLSVDIRIGEQHKVRVITSNTNPPLFRRSFVQLRDQLDVLAGTALRSNHPVITMGNYNLDQFADELQDFRAKAKLDDSRKSMSPSLNPPTNHIFYSDMLECLEFANLYDKGSKRIGIYGEYQFKATPLVE